MSDAHACQCRKSRASEFDAQQAYRRLAQKHDQLSRLVLRFLSDPTPDPAARLANASTLAGDLTTIVGGAPVGAEQFAECCLVGRRTSAGVSWFCTGVLVHPRIALTAAHCFDPAAPANLIALRAANLGDLGGAELVRVRRMLVHPGYPQGRRENDIAVMVLRSAATTPPVAMATSPDVAAAVDTTLVGFGNDDVLSTRGFGTKRQVGVPIVFARRTPADDLDNAEEQLDFESDSEFVAGGGGFDSCNGDSGGPAYIQVGLERRVAGLTSRGTATAQTPCGEGGIYTRVDAHVDFVRQTAAHFGIQI